MKKPTPWAEDIEKAIDKAYQQGYVDAISNYSRQMTECYEFASKIMRRTAAFRPPNVVAPASISVPVGIVAPKRKAVTANGDHISAAYYVLCHVEPRYAEMTAKNVAQAWDLKPTAYRLAGAALKALVADGRATVKRGKYAQAQPRDETQTADGATSEAP